MFDGNHRSRRQVNLGGAGVGGGSSSSNNNNKKASSSRRRGRTSTRPVGLLTSAHHSRNSLNSLPAFTAAAETGGRESLLEQTRLLREERRRIQLEEKSVTKIQKVYRGWKERKVVARELLERLWHERQQRRQQQMNDHFKSFPCSFQYESFLLSLRLSPPLLQAMESRKPTLSAMDLSATLDSWLLEHAASIHRYSASTQQHHHQQQQLPPYAISFRIVQAVLTRLRQLQQQHQHQQQHQQHASSSSTSLSKEDQFKALFGILDYYLKDASLLWKRIGGAKGLLLLLQSTQECLWWNAENNMQQQQQQQSPSNTNTTTTTIMMMMMRSLWNWSCQAVSELDQNSPLQQAGHAILAAIVMGHHTGITKDPASSWWCQYGQQQHQHVGGSCRTENNHDGALYESYFASLVQHVLHSHENFVAANTGDSTENDNSKNRHDLASFSHILTHILRGRWHIVLSNALDWQQATTKITTLQASKKEQKRHPSTALLQFLHHVLTHHNDLAILTSMVARGDDIKSMVLLQQQQQEDLNRATNNNNHDVEDDDDDDDKSLEDEMEEQTAPMPMMMATDGTDNAAAGSSANNQNNDHHVAAASSKKHKSSSTSRKLTKQDLLTMPQLERIYQEGIQRQTNHTVSVLLDQSKSHNRAARAYAESLVEMAIQIGNPALWIAWGNMLLSSDLTENGSSATTAMTDTAGEDDATAAKIVFVKLLARVLKSATGLRSRTSASSPFLSQLAFAGGGTMIEQLWVATCRQRADASSSSSSSSSQDAITCTILTVFSDVFAHSLIALSDEKFLQQYTNVNDLGASKKVTEEEVIGYLRNLLHEVYWTKPVVVKDIKLAAGSSSSTADTSEEDELRVMRARFLLSGTKLWSSLYERWCRLVRSTPFCDESAWWFPHLASQEGDSAVVNAAAQRQGSANGDPNGVAPMDIDDSDEEDDDDGDHRMQTGTDTSQPEVLATADAESDALASSFRDPKMARVLTCIPQALPFDRRVRLFDSLLTADKLKTQDENAEFRMAMVMMMRGEENPMGSGRERVEIRRDRLYDDSMRQLNTMGPRLKKKVQVAFINQHGTQEAGIDGGGVFKEFVDDLISQAFSIETKNDKEVNTPRLFTVTPLQTLTVNSALMQDNDMLSHYEFLGRVLGKAVYESILVEPQFCLPFLNQLLGKRNSLEDLKNFDMEYYKNLTKLLSLNEKEIQDLGLTFELTIGKGPSMRTVELLPGGHSKQVTKQNAIQYVHLVAHQRLNVEGAVQTRSFLRGFRDLIPAPWVRLFSANELQKLISGDDSLVGFDVISLRRTMKYAAGYHSSQPIMQWFWEVLEEFTPDQQRKFLKFMTSCSRQPLLGFSSLDPPPCVQQIRLPDDLFSEDDLSLAAKNAPLPTSSTCMNLLKLPNYRTKELLRKKLIDAIESGAGFELT